MEIKVLDKGLLALVDTMGTDQDIVDAARKSYKTLKKYKTSTRDMMRMLLRSGHGTPFEMVEMKFYVRAPIFVFRQWHRHRTASINEMSGRYTELDLGRYEPDSWRYQSKTNKQGSEEKETFTDILLFEQKEASDNRADMSYQRLLKGGVAKELARIVLPVSQYSDMYWKCDLRNIFNFLKLRLDSHAQWEIRQYAEVMADMVKEKFPLAYEAFEDYTLNAVNFSAMELPLIKVFCTSANGRHFATTGKGKHGNIDPWFKPICLKKGLTEREYDEFLDKLRTLYV